MKDSTKVVSRKLQLSKTTLRALSPEALAEVAGGTLLTRTGGIVILSQVQVVCGATFDADPGGKQSMDGEAGCTGTKPGPIIVVLPPPF